MLEGQNSEAGAKNLDKLAVMTGGDEIHALLAGCADRDRSAFQRLFDAEAGRMKGIAMRVLHNSDLAEDALQEAFIQIWQNADKYRNSLGSPRAWIYTIVRFRAIDILRNRPREDSLDPVDLDRMRDSAAETAYNSLDTDGRLFICLTGLDDRQRQAILLAYVAGLTQGEIAGRTGSPLGTIKSWMRRGLQSLKECLQ